MPGTPEQTSLYRGSFFFYRGTFHPGLFASTGTAEAKGHRASLPSPGASSAKNSEHASASTGVASTATVAALARVLEQL